MQQAAARAAGAAEDPQGAAGALETDLEVVLTEGKAAVLDMKGLLALPYEDGEPIDSLRMLLVPKGKSARVPSRPGHYVVDGPCTVVTFPCWVVFKENMKRPEELAICVSDYGRNSPQMELVSIQSVPKPLRLKNNKYRSELDVKTTSMAHIKGFRPIGKSVTEIGTVSPWFAQFNRYKQVDLNHLASVSDFINMSLATRVPMILEVTRSVATQLAADAGRQDERMQSKTLAKYEAFINGMQAQLTDELLALYDEPLSARIQQYSEETEESSASYLNSPQRRELKEGKLRLLQSRFIVKTVELLDKEDAVDVGQLAFDAAAAIEAEPLSPVEEEPEAAAEVPDLVRLEPPRRARNVITIRRLADEDEGPQHASKKKAGRRAVREEDDEAPFINPRTKKPYVRGGPNKLPKTPAAAGPIARTVRPLANLGDDRASERSVPELYSRLREENEELKKELAALKLENVKLQAELETVKSTSAMEVRLARAEEASVSQKALHEKFVEGIRLGQTMSGGVPAFSPPQYYSSQGGSSADRHQTPAQRSSSYNDGGYDQQYRGQPPY